jgi:hypothetical protein
MKVDLTGVESNSFEILPKGWYRVNVTDVEERISKSEKNPGAIGYNYEFTVQDGAYEGRKAWATAWMIPNALFVLKGMLEASGLYTSDQLEGEFDFEPDDLVGETLLIKIRHRKYEDEMQQDVNGFKPATSDQKLVLEKVDQEKVASGNPLLP